jgi:hypothetical protein
MELKQYIADINPQYQTGMARGRAYRPTLKDCKRITLSSEDEKHYKQIIYVLQQTERIMGEIDEIITEYKSEGNRM